MSTATPTFSTMSESLVTRPTLPDVCRRPQLFKMADYKLEVQCCSGAQWYIIEIPQLSRNPEMSSSAIGSLTIYPHIRKTWQFVRLLKLIFDAVEDYADTLRSCGLDIWHLWNLGCGLVFRLVKNTWQIRRMRTQSCRIDTLDWLVCD